MSARLARNIFASATRCTPKNIPSSTARVSRRTMSATSHTPSKSSDTPWMVGSLLIFGPALLYLLSPSAKKTTHGVHNDHHDFPALKQHEEHKTEPAVAAPVEIMKDDEGTEANVASSIALAEESDVPNDSTSSESEAVTLAAAKTEDIAASESEPEVAKTEELPASEEPVTVQTEKSETSREKVQ